MANIGCPKCGAENRSTAKFCVMCRHPLVRRASSVCARGHRLDPSWDQCPFCKAMDDDAVGNAHSLPDGSVAVKNGRQQRTTMVERRTPAKAPAPREPVGSPPPAPSSPSPAPSSPRTEPMPIAARASVPEVKPSRRTQVVRPRPAADAKPVVAVLVGESRDTTGAVYAVRAGRNAIGSDPTADIRIPDDKVSGKHAVILVRSDEVWIDDSLSTNGTFHNGRMLEEKARLQRGDHIQVGDTLLRFSPVVSPDPSKRQPLA
ncbi:FHA domain-containing protein [Sulfidibacter corallicola]|uniref:FHA domain-containing protein n=1 Tax=Sulfidibacter corallicola TaxID=2818388 RepID=A0A8A4TY14_SULCO|nr:FHA domain-containing protein [Sulfidibacter corallicola]QTD54390.1 FHA domain-containing protein [Sulfidibacter corallicola]